MSNEADSHAGAHNASSPPAPKPRSCAVCRQRRVRCDKQRPRCGNCQKADIPCLLPPQHRQPRWARRFDPLATTAATSTPPSADLHVNVDKVMDRVHNLESLVKELRGQLEQARSSAVSTGSSPATSNPQHEHQHAGASPASDHGSVQSQLGRLKIQDTNRSHYVAGGFWSRIDDELDALKMDIHDPAADDSDASNDEEPPVATPCASEQEHDLSATSRPSLLFPRTPGLSPPDLGEFHPLPSQIPFLFEVFCENVNRVIHIVHLPTTGEMLCDIRSRGMTLSPNQEALAFSIYYAAVASMEDDEVLLNFGSSRIDLTHRFQTGVELSLAKADFLSFPNLSNIQALLIYLSLARRHENPRHVWMLVGLVIRMATFIGLQRDGAQFGNLSPFEIEMRRRTWWYVCMADLKAAEDQGTEPVIKLGSFDTQLPSNLNDTDIGPDTKETPQERNHITDVTPLRIQAGVCNVCKQMMALSGKEWAMEHQDRLVNEIYHKFDHEFFQFVPDSTNPFANTANTVARLVMSKMTLIAFLPVLLSDSNEHLTHEVRTKLLVAAIEVAEYNHTLNAEPAWKKWRWVYQTHTHWYAIVFMMIELSRRPWSPIVERGWTILHSNWLFPLDAHSGKSKTPRVWIPMRKLMAKVRKRRVAEIERLRNNPQEVARLHMEDEHTLQPSSSEPFIDGLCSTGYRERWRQLFLHRGENTSGVQFSPVHTTPSSAGNTKQPDVAVGAIPNDSTYSTAGQMHQYYPQNFSATMAQGAPHPHDPTNWPDSSFNNIPGVWADNGASLDEFLNMDLEAWDPAVEWNDEMNWYSWTQQMNMESSGMAGVEGLGFGGQ